MENMDNTDLRQQSEIDQLHEHAKDNKTTDRLQWAALFLFAIGLSFYLNIVLLSALKSQGATLNNIIDKCGIVK